MAKKIKDNLLELPSGKIADEVLSISDLQTNVNGVDYYTIEVSVVKPEEVRFVQDLIGVPRIGLYYRIRNESLKPIETTEDIVALGQLVRDDVKIYSLDM